MSKNRSNAHVVAARKTTGSPRAAAMKPRRRPAWAGGKRRTMLVILLAVAGVVIITATNWTAWFGTDAPAQSGSAVPRLPVRSAEPLIVAEGDIACDPASPNFNGGQGKGMVCKQMSTSDLALSLKPDAVLLLGDNTYECGGLEAFQKSYDPSWGRLKNITRPAVGNHEYITHKKGATDCDWTGQAMGYFDYFGTSAGRQGEGYYSYELGSWHIIALNSNCSKVGGCNTGSAQYKWLNQDLAAHRGSRCTLAYWHHPLYSRDTSGGSASLAAQPLWQLLYQKGADVVLNGHSHNYQRFSPMDGTGKADNARGIREIVSGEGGASRTPLDATSSPAAFKTRYPKVTPGLLQPRPVAASNASFGVLTMHLHADSYDWQFIPVNAGGFTDSGTESCHT